MLDKIFHVGQNFPIVAKIVHWWPKLSIGGQIKTMDHQHKSHSHAIARPQTSHIQLESQTRPRARILNQSQNTIARTRGRGNEVELKKGRMCYPLPFFMCSVCLAVLSCVVLWFLVYDPPHSHTVFSFLYSLFFTL